MVCGCTPPPKIPDRPPPPPKYKSIVVDISPDAFSRAMRGVALAGATVETSDERAGVVPEQAVRVAVHVRIGHIEIAVFIEIEPDGANSAARVGEAD